MKAEKVTVYRAEDGTIYNSHAEFVAGQAEAKVKAFVAELIANTGGLPSEDAEGNECLYLDDAPAWVAAHAKELREGLADILTQRRPRKPKAEAAQA